MDDIQGWSSRVPSYFTNPSNYIPFKDKFLTHSDVTFSPSLSYQINWSLSEFPYLNKIAKIKFCPFSPFEIICNSRGYLELKIEWTLGPITL